MKYLYHADENGTPIFIAGKRLCPLAVIPVSEENVKLYGLNDLVKNGHLLLLDELKDKKRLEEIAANYENMRNKQKLSANDSKAVYWAISDRKMEEVADKLK